jgi:predicted ABC-type ATPase
MGIAFESVFSAPDTVDFLRRAIDAGYFVRVFFIGTSDPGINAARVAKRVAAGGHTVPFVRRTSPACPLSSAAQRSRSAPRPGR